MKKLFCLMICLALVGGASALAEERPVAAWGLYSSSISNAKPVENVTVREVIELNITGNSCALELSNKWGTEALTVSAVTIAKALDSEGSALDEGTLTAVTFGGEASVTIPAGEEAVSDQVAFAVTAGEWYAVSFYVAGTGTLSSGASMSSFGNVHSYQGEGDLTREADPALNTSNSNPLLCTVNVYTEDEAARAIVVVGDSTSSNSWPTLFQHRLQEAGIDNVSVIYRAASGNRLMVDGAMSYGEGIVNRFDHDVFDTAGASAVIVKVGVNDIFHPKTSGGPAFTLEEMIDAQQDMIDKTHAHGMTIYMMTITPFNGYMSGGWGGRPRVNAWDEEEEAVRIAWNQWMLTSSDLDGCLDLCPLLANADDPTTLNTDYTEDNLHPTEAGCQIIADAVPLEWVANK